MNAVTRMQNTHVATVRDDHDRGCLGAGADLDVPIPRPSAPGRRDVSR
ncbi:hypothetical protein [Agromyces kandeliae]|nr:hypothetical protein [Agromyces kandeliae]